MTGYELHKTGARVSQLLDRQFVVPALDSVPDESTTSWQDGEYVVYFRPGELCRVKVAEEWQFFRLYSIEDEKAVWHKADADKLPDMSDYYTKGEVDNIIADIDIPAVDLSNYYTKEDADAKLEEQINAIVFPEDESIRNVTQEEYDSMLESNALSDKTLYFVSKDNSPVALYIGKVQIAVREEGSKGFEYNFPIIF